MTSPEPAAPGPLAVAVVGTGLMGTSIALAASRAGDAVRGFDLFQKPRDRNLAKR